MRVLTLATSKQNGESATTGDPPNVVDNDNLQLQPVLVLDPIRANKTLLNRRKDTTKVEG